MIKRFTPNSVKKFSRSFLKKLGYEIVYLDSPGQHHRFPYANQRSFFQDVKKRGFDPRIVIDIGANKGSWSLEVAEIFPGIRSLMAEPQDKMITQLEKICESHKDWNVIPYGIAGKTGKRRFKPTKDTVSSTFSFEIYSEDDENIEILEVITLEDMVEKYLVGEKIDLLKIDAEGLEVEIIEGSREIVQSCQMVMLEIPLFQYSPDRPTFAEVVELMYSLDFSIYDFSMFYRRPYDGALGLMDCVFVSNQSPLRRTHQWR